MHLCMRTTIDLPDSLIQKAKNRMHKNKQTLRSLIIKGLEQVLEEDSKPFRLRDASVGSPNSKKISSEEINKAIDAQREDRFAG